jgi:hypothetical protein
MKRRLQARTYRLALFVAVGAQTHRIARMIVHDRQGMAGRSIRQRHPALEVHLPQQVRRRLLKPLPGLSRLAAQGIDPAVATQDRVHRRAGRTSLSVPLQTTHDLAGAPRRMRIAHRKHPRLDRRRAAPGARMRTARAIRKWLAPRRPTAQPFIAGLRADPEPPTQLAPVHTFLHRQPNKLTSLVHDRHLSPRHGRPSFEADSMQC